MLPVLIPPTYPAYQSAGGGPDCRSLAGISADRSSNGTHGGTAHRSSHGCGTVGCWLGRGERRIVSTLLHSPSMACIAILILLRGALALGWIDDKTLRLARRRRGDSSKKH